MAQSRFFSAADLHMDILWMVPILTSPTFAIYGVGLIC